MELAQVLVRVGLQYRYAMLLGLALRFFPVLEQELAAIMDRAFREVLETSQERRLPMRMAAYVVAVSRVASATRDRGLYP